MDYVAKMKRDPATGEWNIPATWKNSGVPREEVRYQVPGEERYRSRLLDESVNGSRPPVGARVHLTMSSRLWESAEPGRDGRPYIKRVELESVVKLEVVKS
jgi:hypothetical protein